MASASIGRYRVVRQIGAGRHGRTFEAERDDGRHVALREVECEGLDAADRIASDPSLHRLCTIIAGLSQENLADTVEVFALGRRVYVAEEFLQSPDLSQVLAKSGPLPLEEARAITCQVLAGLEFGHQRGLLHLDLRTSNVHYDREAQRAILTDFGHMQLLLELRPPRSLAVISDRYHAPEVRAGRAPTPASEVYSVAVILHELLTGQLPRPARGTTAGGRFDFLEVASEGGLRPADEVLDELAERWPGVIFVLRRALSAQPEERYQRAHHMLMALVRAYRADVRGEVYSEGPIEAEPRPRRGREPAEKAASEAPVKVTGGVRFCESCGRPMAPDSDVCISCGAKVGAPVPTAPEPKERSYFQKHGDRLMSEGRYAQAEKAFGMAAQRRPRDPVAQRELGDVLTINRKFAAAEAAYREALRLDPDDLRARHELSRVLLSQNQGAEAITELHKLLDRGPPRAMRLSALTQLGAAYASVGQRSSARNTWEEVLAAEPGNSRVHYALANSFLSEGDARRAREHLREAVKADPGYAEAKRSLQQVERQIERAPAGGPLMGPVSVSREAMLMEQALSQLGGMLGREGWGSRSSRSTWGWSESDGWRLLDSTETTSGGRWVPIEEVDSLDEDEDEDES